MAFDARRVIVAAVEAALDDGVSAAKPDKKRSRLSGGRAFLLGAGLVTAARLASGSRGRELLESVQDRLAEWEERLIEDEDENDREDDREDEDWEEEPEEEYAEQGGRA
jgi:hypothetical protein